MTHQHELTATMKTHKNRLCMYDALSADMFPPTQTRTGRRLVRDLSARKSHRKYFFVRLKFPLTLYSFVSAVAVTSMRPTATHLVLVLGLF